MFVGSLGDLIFEVSNYKVLTFKDFKREGGAKYATHEVIGQPPKLEFLHRELEKLSLEIDLVSSLGVNPEDEIQKITDMCNDGEANYLIFGGQVYGDDDDKRENRYLQLLNRVIKSGVKIAAVLYSFT